MAETIEGYRFTVDLDDRGMRTKLSDLAKEARTLKSIMRANFNENMSVGNSYQAFSQKITDANRAIEQYNISIKQAQQDIKELPERLEKAKEEYNKLTDEQKKNSEEGQRLANEMKDLDSRQLSLINKIQNYRNQISSLNRVITDAERHQQNYNRTLEQYRAVSAGMSSAMSSYNRMLEESGMRALTTKGRVSQLTEQHRLLSRQSQLETAQARKLQSSLATLQQKYVSSAAAVRKAADAHGKESDEYKKAASAYSLARSNMETATADMQKQVAASAKVTGQVMKMRSAINSVGTGRLGSVARAFNNIDTRVRAATSHTRAYANSLKGSLMGVSIGVTAFGAGVGKAVSMSMQLQNQWVTTKNLLQTGAKNAAEAREEVGKLSTMERDARNYSKEYGYSQKEIAEQYTELVKRGYSAGQSIGSMKSMLQAARASGDDYADVVKNVSSTLDAFDLRQGRTTKQVVANSKRVTNAMAYAADMTATDFQDMGEAMSYVSASAHQAGQSVEVTTAAIGELSNAGIEGTRAGTGLRKVFNSLTAPTAGAQEALQKYGMSIDDFKTKSGALKSLPEIMKTINEHTKNLGKADKAAFFKAVFGTTGQQAAMVLAQNSKAMADLVEQEKKAEKHNYVHQLAEKNMATTQMQLQKLKTSIQDIAITMGNKLLPAINDVVAGFGKWESSKAGQKAIEDFGNAVAGVAKTIGRNSGSIMSFIGGFTEGLLGVVGVAAKVVGWLGKMVGGIGKFFGLGSKVPQAAGIITGALVGIIGVYKILRSTISGVSAVIQDGKNLFHMRKQTSEIETQDSLYERMIELQERSLELSEAQAKAQGIDTESLGKKSVGQEAENIANDIPVGGKSGKAVKSVQIQPYLDESKSSRVGNWFKSKLPSFGAEGGAKAGAKASTGFLGKFKALPGLIKGAGIFGKIMDIGMSFFAAFDMAKGIMSSLTNSKAKGRYKAAGKTMAEGVGWYLGGPMTSQIAGLAMDWAYSAVDNFKKGWNGYTKNYKPKGLVATIGWDFKDATRKYNNWIASIEKKHPVIAVPMRLARGTVNTLFASVKYVGRHLHNSLKDVWTGISDIARGKFSSILKDQQKNHANMIKGIKSDWKGFFSWFTKNRQKETIHKPTRDEPSRSSKSSSSKVRSLGNTKYSKSDVQNLKAMTAQIGSYEKALKGLKATIKSNDPTSELRHMNKELKGASTNWGKVAKPIKKIGDAFKYLAKFTSSMSKKDAFAALNKDLPKLAATVKSKGKVLTNNLNSLGKSLTKNRLIKPLEKLDKQIKTSIKTWKNFTGPVKSLAKSFKTLQNATKTLTDKKKGLEVAQKGFKDLDKALKGQKIGKYLKSLASDIKKSKIDKELASISKDVSHSAKDWKSLAKPILSVSKSFKTLNSAVKGLAGSKKSGFTKLTADIKDLYRTVRKYPFGKQIASQASIANNAMSGKKAGFVGRFTQATNQMTRALRNFGRTFNREWKGTWKGLASPVERELNSAERAEGSRLDAMEDKRSDFSSAFLKGWKSWIDDVVSSFKSGFNKLPEYASSAMKDIVSRLNKGISGINAVIGDFGGDKKLSAISYATGTKGGHPGGHMLVNDSTRPHYKELVKFPGRPWRMFEGKNVFIPNAPRGTQVINGEQTFALNSRGLLPKLGVHAYANGSLSDEEQEKLSEEFEKNPKEASKELVLKLTNWSSNVPIVADLGQAIAVGFSQGIANVLKDQLASAENPPGTGVERWRKLVIRALKKNGFEASDYQVNAWMRVIQRESNGNPYAVNNWDSNAKAGHPSMGLVQTIQPTFDSYAFPGHHNIFNGYDDLLAGIAYMAAKYGRGSGAFARVSGPEGYANGGFVQQSGIYQLAEEGIPEAIIPLDINKRPRALSLIDRTLDTMEHDGGGTGGLHSRSSASNSETTAYLKQAVAILGQIAGLSAQQIDAIMNINPGTDMKSRRQRSQFYNQYGNDQRIRDYQAF